MLVSACSRTRESRKARLRQNLCFCTSKASKLSTCSQRIQRRVVDDVFPEENLFLVFVCVCVSLSHYLSLSLSLSDSQGILAAELIVVCYDRRMLLAL